MTGRTINFTQQVSNSLTFKQKGKAMYSKRFIPAIFLLAAVLFAGCSRAPAGMVPVYPCKIKITKGGEPVSNVGVALSGGSSLGSYSMGGNTNASGVAEIGTVYGSYITKGSPAGEFQVTLVEVPTLPDDLNLSREQLSKLSGPEMDAHNAKVNAARAAYRRSIPLSFAGADSPLKMTVAESRKGTEATFELDDYR